MGSTTAPFNGPGCVAAGHPFTPEFPAAVHGHVALANRDLIPHLIKVVAGETAVRAAPVAHLIGGQEVRNALMAGQASRCGVPPSMHVLALILKKHIVVPRKGQALPTLADHDADRTAVLATGGTTEEFDFLPIFPRAYGTVRLLVADPFVIQL